MKMRTGYAAFSLLLGLTAPPAFAEGEKTEKVEKVEEARAETPEPPKSRFLYVVEMAGATAYIWRGSRVSTGLLEPVLQPHADLGVSAIGPGDIWVGAMTNRALTGAPGVQDSAWEVDAYAWYTPTIGPVALRVGYILYLFPDAVSPNPVDALHELVAIGSFNLGIPVTPYAGVYVEPIRLRGVYGVAGATHTISPIKPLKIETTLNAGVTAYDGVPLGLQDITLSSRGTLAIGDSGLYTALVLAAAYYGRAGPGEDRFFPYVFLGVGFAN